MSAHRHPIKTPFTTRATSLHTPRALTLANVIAGLSLAASNAFAQAQGAPGGQPPGPPPEAYTACKGLAEGASVTLTMPDGKTLHGTCRTMNGTLVAMPAGGPPHGAGGPPPAR
ncbi:hypothetical protein [Acidovorax sp. SUPP3334]|uniref:hypothetical protein n=1 Tax=Acidovorax sp. SUPP3334 TaxID=2920881 RepID=UPI0023DE2C1B|nr:hypothetical protein [Acidovorax sp. SUPP3334]GKT26467.1 hypothetical protein AVHM3334_21105 [Acidovorax sp. SUPP3334]